MTNDLRRFVVSSVLGLVLFVVMFGFLAEELVHHKLAAFDTTIINQVQSWIDVPLTYVMKFFTNVGSPVGVAVLTIICASVMWLSHKRWEAGAMVVGCAGAGLFNAVLKWVFHRQRPDLHRLISVKGYSFPSGHSIGAMVFYGLLAYFIALFARALWVKVVAYVWAACMIVMIGLSRIYLGVHYPSDVLAGYVAGLVWLIVCSLGLRLIVEHRRKKPENQVPAENH